VWAQVALEKGANEVASPREARGIRPGQKGPGKSAPQPTAGAGRLAHLRQRERRELHERDAPRERLARLLQQRRRRAAQHEKPAADGTSVGEDAQGRKELRAALDLVEHHQTAPVGQRQHRVGQLREIAGVLEIEEGDVPPPAVGDRSRQRGLADLPRAEQGHDGRLPEGAVDPGAEVGARQGRHGLKYRRSVPNYQGNCRTTPAGGGPAATPVAPAPRPPHGRPTAAPRPA